MSLLTWKTSPNNWYRSVEIGWANRWAPFSEMRHTTTTKWTDRQSRSAMETTPPFPNHPLKEDSEVIDVTMLYRSDKRRIRCWWYNEPFAFEKQTSREFRDYLQQPSKPISTYKGGQLHVVLRSYQPEMIVCRTFDWIKIWHNLDVQWRASNSNNTKLTAENNNRQDSRLDQIMFNDNHKLWRKI